MKYSEEILVLQFYVTIVRDNIQGLSSKYGSLAT